MNPDNLKRRLAALYAEVNRIGDAIERKHDCGDYFGATVLRKELRRCQERASKLERQIARLAEMTPLDAG